jgi:hypothetical protein
MDGALELAAEGAGVFTVDARHEHALLVFQYFHRDFHHLLRRFAAAEDDFGKPLAQRAMGVHLSEAEVGEGRRLEGTQDFIASGASGAEFFEQLNGLGRGHNPMIFIRPRWSRQIWRRFQFAQVLALNGVR